MEPFHFNSTVFLLLPLLTLSLFFELFSVNALGQCLPAESSALLQLKRGFTSGELDTWRQGTDCCIWEGVTCDESKRVIKLDLSNRSIAGTINPSLFNLTSLRSLNFAYNQFHRTPIPDSGWNRLANLSSLNLSFAGFYGEVPTNIFGLTKLTSLDLSSDYVHSELEELSLSLTIKPTVLRNMSNLRELYLDYVNLSAYGDEWCGALANSTPVLEALSMYSCSLFGSSCSSLSLLPFLSVVHLGFNNLDFKILESFANFTSLSELGVEENEFQGFFPNKIFQLRNLKHLYIYGNPMLSGSLPDFPEDSNLETLELAGTNFSGKLPDTIGNLKFLTILGLSSCQFFGRITSLMGNLSKQMSFNLSVPDTHICPNGKLCNLETLDLSNNSFSGPIPTSVFTLPALASLQLQQNQFSGQLAEFSNASLLTSIDLHDNKLQGKIPRSLFQISGLDALSLDSNNFSGVVELDFIKNLKNLYYLNFSYSGFSLSPWDADDGSSSFFFPKMIILALAGCNLTRIPAFIKYQHLMYNLDLSNNRIQGEIPSWVWSITVLDLSCNLFTHIAEPSFNLSSYQYTVIIDFHANMLEGPIPALPSTKIAVLDFSNNRFTSFISSNISYLYSCKYFSLANNNLIGEIPASICNLTALLLLDLSENKLTGSIPPCLLEDGINLQMLNLRGNQLHGAIPDGISPECALQTINLSDNQLEGLLPRSLTNCQSLEMLNLGNNNLKDNFPYWLGNMPSLRVLILRSNKFHGLVGPPDINHETNLTFHMLDVFDISSNNFSGNLCAAYFINFKSMMINTTNTMHDFAFHMGLRYYSLDVLIIWNKGQQMILQKFNMIFKSIDFSNNHFEGEIPTTIGQLISLQVLNMSHNYLTSKIPPQLGKLSQLESLDLSMNNLSGTIPQELISLYFLSYLNLSYNKLVGKIPLEGQFCTFSNTSFEGNEGLHWFPCNNTLAPVVNNTSTSPAGLGGTEGRSYMIVLGILFGVGFGVGMATVVVLDVLCYGKCRRRRSRRHTHR